MPNPFNSTSKFNWSDYMQLRAMIMDLNSMANELYLSFQIKTMRPIKTYDDYFYAEDFNRIEENLEITNKHVFTQDIGETKTFYDNGQFIKYDELNRLINGLYTLSDMLKNQAKNRRKLEIRLGNMKGVKC